MKKETLLLIVIALAAGILGGVIIANNDQETAPQPNVAAAPQVNYQQKIQLLTGIVSKDPTNRNAWVELGHSYFDSGQSMQAIDAYDKALELDRIDPDVLTDQGIMYRRVGWFDKAIKNFTKANEQNPKHPQSLYNLGLVYRDDLQDKAKAKEAWTKYLDIAPAGDAANRVFTMLDHMENGHN